MNGDRGDDARDVKHEYKERQEFHEHQRGIRGARKDNVCPERGTARDDVRTPQERARARLQAHFDAGTTPDLSLQEHVLAAMEMEATSGHLEDFKVMFTFTRAMKTATALDEKTAAQALAEIEKVIARWPLEDDDLPENASIARRAAAQWAKSLGVDAEDARANFLGIWDKVRTLPNRSPLDHALELAERRPINFPDSSCLKVDTEGYRRFVSLAGWLQVTRGNAPILLPVEKVGGRLGVKAMTVSRYRDWGELDGFLSKVAEHRFRSRPSPSGERSTATEYRFDVSRVPMLEHAAQRGGRLRHFATPRGDRCLTVHLAGEKLTPALA